MIKGPARRNAGRSAPAAPHYVQHVLWEPAEDGPERFYLRLGFEKTGELFGEVVGTLKV